VVTRISFDADSDFPKLKFEPKSWVSDEQYAIIQQRYASEEAKAVTTTLDAPAQPTPTASAAAQPDPGQFSQAVPTPEETKQPEPEPEPEKKVDPWAQATQAASKQAEEKPDPEPEQQTHNTQADAFAQAGWGTPGKPAAAQDKTPPKQEHKESAATVSEGGDESLDSVFGAGFDD